MFLYLLPCLFMKKQLSNTLKCMKGAWVVQNDCRFLQKHFIETDFEIHVVKRSFIFNNFIVDVNPRFWRHPGTYYISPISKQPNLYSVRNSRLRYIGDISLTFGPHCEVNIGHMVTEANYSFYGHVTSGKGFVTFSSPRKVCQLNIEKKVEYSNWRFGFTIFVGIFSMFLGFQTLMGWSVSDIEEPLSIPIDNPGEEFVLSPLAQKAKKIQEAKERENQDDKYNSEDGY
ncbi:hypothetical protein TRFO_41900 [Tritrichomonas foetus]|uniref:Uncharacterized protein n=1 Tax=Tritrichomonas foetus TaxID=1144522 RepID=A0A1J4L2W9_9EUKA|nr:hypothetical protein TRFO_41900 [Tritrichomonas foetus]|eukprot:OHT16253.1 hypothetical protein TRFO_41900 [Tritrichomonas foetus]